MTIKALQSFGYARLKNVVLNPEYEADTLLAHVLKVERMFLYAHPEKEVMKGQETRYKALITRRKRREPFAYLMGSVEFCNLNFKVTPDVLIPRPETEQLVEESLKLAKNTENIIDVGTGSGAIIISVAKALLSFRTPIRNLRSRVKLGMTKKSDVEFFGLDISAKALKIARQNAKHLVPKVKIAFKKSDLLSTFNKLPPHTVVVANLPYLEPVEVKRHELSYEPKVALLGGKEGLDLIYRLILEFKLKSHSGDYLLLEIGYKQAAKIKDLVKRLMPVSKVTIKKDYSGYDRIVRIEH